MIRQDSAPQKAEPPPPLTFAAVDEQPAVVGPTEPDPPAVAEPLPSSTWRPRPPIDGKLPVAAAIVIAVSYLLLGVGIAVGVVLMFASLAAAKSAIHEATVGALFAAMFVAAYIVTRCIEKIVRAFARM